jgi:hypothetical protein
MKPLFTLKESKQYPGLFVKKYTKQVFWNNLWNPELVESRGHVFNADGKLVISPFTKIFNRGENGTDIPRDHMCLCVQKVNGFMAAVTYVPEIDTVVISTTGSLDSDFVEMAREKIDEDFIDDLRRDYLENTPPFTYTFLFEIVHENDPHIINEIPGAYLIGRRRVGGEESYHSTVENETLLDEIAENYDLYRPMWTIDKFSDIVDAAKVVNHEGFVVYDNEGSTSLKIKSPYYLTAKAMARCKDIFTLDKRRIDEEYYPLLDNIKNSVEPSYWESMDEQDKLEFIRDWVMK